MSELKPISPLLDGFLIGKPMSYHDGVCCCPGLKEDSQEKYIVKIISVPASHVQMEALLVTGAYRTHADAMDYFKEVADGIVKEVEFLNTVAKLEGFLPYDGYQIEPMEEGRYGYEVYLLSTYKRSLERYMRRRPLTHLEAVNLGLDLCTALATCRRSGYLYVNLKPSNIFLTRTKEFRISDLGFIHMDSLAYASMPGKYRSPYSPPEARDDMKTLNTTVDTYAAGMILYQVYNDGALPEEPRNPRDPFHCPANADYEISSIIMKAIDPDPDKRWQSPMEMGQALVGYMQRNTVNNVPITPPSGILGAVQDPAVVKPQESVEPESAPEETAVSQDAVSPVREDTPAPTVTAESDGIAPESSAEVPADPVSEEKPETVEDPAEESAPEDEFDDMDFSIAFQGFPEEEASEPKPQPRQIENLTRQRNLEKQEKARKARRVLASIIAVLVLILLICGGFWFYQTQYLQTIDDLTIEGNQSELTVTVKTTMEQSKLMVSCTDTYGNSSVKPLENGSATFTDLLPDSLYRIELTVDGFHELRGKTAEIFTTDALTSVAAISAMTGPEDGSVNVNFTVDGKDPEEWLITCTTVGEEPITKTFTGHSVTVKGLTPGNEYVITLGTADGTPVLGDNTVHFLATNLIMAENLTILSCQDGTLTVSWNAPEDTSVERWKVRCYNDEGHEEVLEITGTEIAFTDIDNSKAYTVEVTAAGMTNPSRISITANPITVTDLTIDTSDVSKLTVNWDYEGAAPEGGWLLIYNFAGYPEKQNVIKCETNQAVIDNRIPGATYQFQLQAADSTTVFSNLHSFSCPNAEIFSSQGMDASKLTAHLLKTPEEEGWTAESVGKDVYTDTFRSGDKISIILHANAKFFLPEMDIEILYVIRDGDGYVLSDHITRQVGDWKDLWYDGDYKNAELDLPTVPTEPGTYNLSLYFNNMAITSIGFQIS